MLGMKPVKLVLMGLLVVVLPGMKLELTPCTAWSAWAINPFVYGNNYGDARN